jgi:superfamily I DNA/RNA helicase
MNITFQHSQEQERIFSYLKTGKGNAVVQARAGSGKTYTNLYGLESAPESSIYYGTFGKYNQLDAASKIKDKTKIDARTFNSLGNGFVARNWRRVKPSGYTEFNRIKTIYPEAPKQVHFQTASLVSYLKGTLIRPTLDEAIKAANLRGIDAGNHANQFSVQKMAEMALESIKLSLEYPRDGRISFDDQIFLPNALGWIQKSYDMVVIDECQDLSLPQLSLAMGVCKDGGRIIMTGDDRQGMFGWRGGMSDCMGIFQDKLNAQQLKLTISYRCPKNVIKLAQTIVPDIQAAPNAIDGIVETGSKEKMESQIKVNDVILSRTNAPLAKHALSLIRKRIPAYVRGREIGSELKRTIDDIDARDATDFLSKLEIWQSIRVARATGWLADTRIAAINDTAETLRVLAESAITVEDIRNNIDKLFLDADGVKVPSVILSTVHRFKGLQAINVNVLMESFKGRRGLTPIEQKEEENILYVAYTRSQSRLSLIS